MSKHAPGSGSLKDLEQRKREVFKPLLENPFSKGAEWPPVERSTAETIMECLTQVLSGYGSYLEMKKSDKRKAMQEHELAGKITIGFNSTVKKLEEQAKPNRARLLGKASTIKKPKTEKTGEKYVKYVFVAKSDISTTLLTSCFPLLTFAASASAHDRVKLVELPRGASNRLSDVLRTENVSILSFEAGWKGGKLLFDVVNSSVGDVAVPWLEGLFDDSPASAPRYEKPNIKFVKTTVPIGKVAKTKQKPVLKKKKNRKGVAEKSPHEKA
ncbi:hypothetical protein JCM33374_g6659 [Metschnikowia sp. JCM 33374]|nr:hypothetical protein JCM33374_g6659 [Metschnikowia sp. JCM 33374]